MQIRAYLFLMAAGILIPVIVFSGLARNMLQNAEKAAALRGLNETARGIALLVDRELYSAEAALQVLAASPALARGDMAAFYQEAKVANRGPTGWTFLQDRSGDQLVNTFLPYGAELPDAFILDIGLPDMTGYELARRLRAMEQFTGATMIALTGYGQPQDKVNARLAGFDEHVAKPAEPAYILDLLALNVTK